MVDERALAILKKQGSQGITIVSLQRKIIFDIQFNQNWPKWQTKCSKQPAKDFETSKFHQDMSNRYVMLGFVSVHIPWNAMSNLEPWRSYKPLRDHLVLPPAMTLSNLRRKEYALTMDAIKKQLPIRNEVSLAFEGWTSTNKLGITSVIAYNMDQKWALRDIQLAFDEGDRLFSSRLES